MVNKDVVLEKVGQIQNCLRRIQDKTGGKPETLDNLDVQDIFVLNLQRAVQTVIDLAAHLVADEGLGLPDNLKESFSLLEKAKIVTPALSKQLQKMVGFRNIAIHEYSTLDVAVLKSILTEALGDLEKFYTAVLKHFHLTEA